MIDSVVNGHQPPEGWQVVKLREVCSKTILTDPTKRPDQPFTYIDVSSVSNESYRIIETKEILGKDAPSRARKAVAADDVIFATVRPTLKRIALIPVELDRQVCSTGYCVVRAAAGKAIPAFLYFFLLTEEVLQQVDNLQKGATYPAISDADLLDLPLALPPLPEQRAIAHALGTVQAAREARRREAALERERKAALMQRLFTQGTRGEPTKTTEIGEVPVSWNVVRLEEAVQRTQYGLSIAGKAAGSIPILRMNSLSDGGVAVDSLQYVDLDQAMLNQFKLNKGDLLFNRTNSYELVGKTGLFKLDTTFVFASYLVRVVLLLDKAEPAFFNAYLNWIPTQMRLKAMASRAVSQSNINAAKLVTLPVPLPSLAEQRTIAEVLRVCDDKIAALDREAAAHNELFKALLEELMTGRLRVETRI